MGWWSSIDQLSRVSTLVQWLLILCAALTTCLSVGKLVVAKRLEGLKDEKTARTEAGLRKRTISRLLSGIETQALEMNLRKFSGQPFEISALADHGNTGSEQYEFLDQLRAVLTNAGWLEKKCMVYTGVTEQGVKICARPGDEAAGRALHEQLEALSIDSTPVPVNDGERMWVLVGIR